MTTKRMLTGLMAGVMTLSVMTASASATYSELAGKWYEADMITWIQRGVITGDESGYRAEDYITRGEMATMINRVLQYQTYAYNSYYDLPANQYYTQPMLSLVQAGVLNGYSDTMMMPNVPITREEAVTMMARTLQIDKFLAPVAGFRDQYSISPYAQNAVNSMVASGYIQGDEFGFRPQDPITRAEVAAMMTRVFDGSFYPATPAPTYPSYGTGNNIVVTNPNTRLQDMRVYGDVLIEASVGTGSVYLDNVTVQGDIIIVGTSKNTVYLDDTDVMGAIYDNKTSGYVKIDMAGSSTVEDIYTSNYVLVDTDDLSSSGDLDNIQLTQDDVTVTVVDGYVDTITVESDAEDADITVQSGASVDTIYVNGDDAYIDGDGDVDTVEVDADDVSVYTDYTRVEIARGVDGTIVKGREYSDNKTVYSDGWNFDDECRVKFYVEDKLVDTIDVWYGDDINDYDDMPDDPKHPTDSTKTFYRWEDEDGDKFDGNTNVWDDIKVYAEWK